MRGKKLTKSEDPGPAMALPALRRKWRPDWPAALTLICIGAFTAIVGARYPLGGLGAMGPGFFPLVLGALLAVVGVLLLAGSAPAGAGEARPKLPLDLRGWSGVIGGMLAFLILGRHGGLVPATFGLVLLSALGDRRNSLRTAVMLAGVMVVVAVVVFHFGLGLAFPLFAWEWKP